MLKSLLKKFSKLKISFAPPNAYKFFKIVLT
jgi:hypothetical protein